jgi:hypothetical protein
MAGLVPAIHVFFKNFSKQGVDARHKAGHDALTTVLFRNKNTAGKIPSRLLFELFRLPEPLFARAERDEKLVQLRELFAKPACASGGDGIVERFLCGI